MGGEASSRPNQCVRREGVDFIAFIGRGQHFEVSHRTNIGYWGFETIFNNYFFTLTRSLDHPNIVGYRGSKTLSDDRLILAMETCDTSLGDQIETRVEQSLGPLESERIKKMTLDVCKALDYLHNEAHILHGDLKSYNVLIKGDFELCKLCDFGVSLPLTEDGSIDLKKNPDAKYTGTDLWSAPEVFNDNIDEITTKTDMFSFGLIIYECVALQAPHAGYTGEFDCSHTDNSTIADLSESNNENTPPPAKQAKKLFSDLNESDVSIQTHDTDVSSTDVTLDETNESSILIKSTAATMGDNTVDAIENYLGTRPPIPDVYDLPADYNVVLEIFFLCTHELPEDRPDASYLAKHLEKIAA